MAANRAVGIDLGTSFCAMARLDQAGRSVMARNPQGDTRIPAVVFFDDAEMLFGRAANQAAVTAPQRAAESAKRDLGQPAYSRAIAGELLPVEFIEACLLKNLADDLQATVGGPPAVVLNAPISFDHVQRQGIVHAGRIAGLDLLGTINDPLAAALAFAEVQGYLSPDAADRPGCRALVFDLGGGKLDAAIVEIKPGRLRTLAVGGDPRLGGRDWDLRLADHLAAQFSKQFGDDPRFDMVSVRRLLSSSEEAKHTLTARQQARVRVERGGNVADVTVPRHVFEEAAAELVDRARRVAEGTIAQAGMAWRDVGHLLLVGGATRMPMIAGMVESLTGLKAATNLHADEAVARGAALYAGQLLAAREGRKPATQLEITDLTAHSLGMAWREAADGKVENVVLIRRGTELPCGTSSKLTTQMPDQTSVDVELVEGESRDADECSRIARIRVSRLPAELPRHSPIEMLYEFTADGRLQVKARLVKSGQALAIDVLRDRGLDEIEIGAWKQLLQGQPGLKAIHALAAKHAAELARTLAEQPASHATSQSVPPPSPSHEEDFQLNVDRDSSADRFKKPRSSRRSLLIAVSGHVVFALLGLVIGYYILMMLRPEWNVLHLRLPGIRQQSPRGDNSQMGPRLAGDDRHHACPRSSDPLA